MNSIGCFRAGADDTEKATGFLAKRFKPQALVRVVESDSLGRRYREAVATFRLR